MHEPMQMGWPLELLPSLPDVAVDSGQLLDPGSSPPSTHMDSSPPEVTAAHSVSEPSASLSLDSHAGKPELGTGSGVVDDAPSSEPVDTARAILF